MTPSPIIVDIWPALARLGAVAIAAFILSTALIVGSRAVLVRYAMAHPNGRSSHRNPTPQGGGIGVIGATIIAASGVALLIPETLGDPGRVR